MYSPITYFLVPGEISTLTNDADTRTPQNLILFTVAVYEPTYDDDEDYYIIFELGDNNEKGACAALTHREYMNAYYCINSDANSTEFSRTVAGDTVSSTDISGSPMRECIESFMTAGRELSVRATPFETTNSRGIDLTIGNYDDEGASVTLTAAQCNYFVESLHRYIGEDSNVISPSVNVIGTNPEVVDSAGKTEEVTSTISVGQAVGRLLNITTEEDFRQSSLSN